MNDTNVDRTQEIKRLAQEEDAEIKLQTQDLADQEKRLIEVSGSGDITERNNQSRFFALLAKYLASKINKLTQNEFKTPVAEFSTTAMRIAAMLDPVIAKSLGVEVEEFQEHFPGDKEPKSILITLKRELTEVISTGIISPDLSQAVEKVLKIIDSQP